MLTRSDREPEYQPTKPAPSPARRIAQPDHVRTSEADRKRVVDELQQHFVAGRLSSEELSARVEQVLSSQTFGELALVLHDLPAIDLPPSSTSAPEAPADDRQRRREQRRERRRARRRYGRGSLKAHAMSYALVMGFLVLIWLVTSPEHGYFWPIWPMMGWGIGLASHALATLNRRPEPV